MEKKIERKAAEVTITFTAAEEEWKAAQTKEFNKLLAKVNVPGFRKGHVPASVARGRISPYQVLDNATNTLINKAYVEVLRDEKITPFIQPTLAIDKVSDKELEAHLTIALTPVVTLGQYKNLNVALDSSDVTDEEIEAGIKRDLENHASLVLKEGAAEMGDTVIIDFKGYVDNVPFEGGEAKGYELKLGSNSFIPGFEDQLVGMKSEEAKTITVKFPDNYVENLAGKEATFDVKCHEVKSTVLPELDDEFVAELNVANVTTVEQYRAHVAYNAKVSKQNAANQKRINAIIELAVNNASLEISDTIIEDETKGQIEKVKKQVESNGLEFKDYLAVSGLTEEQFHEQKKQEALNNIKGLLVIDKICQIENIIVDSKALNDKYFELSKQYNMKIEDVEKALEPNKNELLKNLRNELFTKFMLAANPLEGAPAPSEEKPAEAPAEEKPAEEEKPAKKSKKSAKKTEEKTEEKTED